jgi:twinkle protein
MELDLSEPEKAQADAWINDHYLFLHHAEQRPTLEWVLECAETAVVRHGARILQIDPWNRLEAMRGPRENETDYILRCLRALYVFATDMNCHVQVLAHPSKMDNNRRGKPPELEDISGSKHWENVVDQGFVIHRPQLHDGQERRTEAVFYNRKTRFEELGYPCRMHLNYDLHRRLYVPLIETME